MHVGCCSRCMMIMIMIVAPNRRSTKKRRKLAAASPYQPHLLVQISLCVYSVSVFLCFFLVLKKKIQFPNVWYLCLRVPKFPAHDCLFLVLCCVCNRSAEQLLCWVPQRSTSSSSSSSSSCVSCASTSSVVVFPKYPSPVCGGCCR